MTSSYQNVAVGALATSLLLFIGAARAAVEISGKATRNMVCSGGACRPTTKTAVLNAGELAAMLAEGDAEVVSNNAAMDIHINTALSWTSPHRLS